MPRPISSLRCACALLATAAAAALAPAAASAAPTPGLQISAISPALTQEYYGAELTRAKAAGVKVVRTEVRWSELEPKAAGERDPAWLATYDGVVAQAANKGLKLVIVMLSTPCWASSAPEPLKRGCSGSQDEKVEAYPPSDPAAYAKAAAFVTGRHKARVHALEVWNEPDHQNEIYFAGPDKAKRYAAILRATYKASKAVAPGTLVLGGAIVGADGRFLKALYGAGIKGSYDALSVHYYGLVLASLRSIRAVQKANGDRKPLWLGEFGWTSCFPKLRRQGGHDCVSAGVQSASIQDIFRALKRTTYLKGAVVYHANDSTQYDFGLFTRQGKAKPALVGMRNVLRRTGAPRRVQLSLRRSAGQVVASGSGPAGDAYEVLVFQGSTLRYKATFTLGRDLRYSLKLPRQLGTRGLKVRVYQYWLGGGALRSI